MRRKAQSSKLVGPAAQRLQNEFDSICISNFRPPLYTALSEMKRSTTANSTYSSTDQNEEQGAIGIGTYEATVTRCSGDREAELPLSLPCGCMEYL